MKHLITLAAIALDLTSGAIASEYYGENDLIAEVSFEHSVAPGPRDAIFTPRAYSVQFYAHGEIHLVDLGGGDEWYIQPVEERVAYQLDEEEYNWLMEVIYLLGESELAYNDAAEDICRMEPPLVNSDLYILGYQEDYSLVLSDSGCWREFYVYPLEDELYQQAAILKDWLLVVGKALLNG